MMAKTDRLLDLIQILRDGQLHRASDLAAALDVSVRTIWRDMAALMASGLPIEGERGVGYMLSAPTTLPPVTLTRDELEALRLGIVLVATSADPVLSRAAASLRAKVAAVAPGGADEAGADSFVFSSPEAARAAPHLSAIRRALREHLVLTVAYRDASGRSREVRLRPLQLENWGRLWTLAGWSETAQDFRVLRVDRIERLAADGGGFLPEPGRTVEDYVARLTAPA
jgi:predicted DNA-binding transcriptional regulator YafY